MNMRQENDFWLIREMVRSLLINATKYTWTLQGFGMLRLYFENDLRLAVWDSRYRVENVSLLHTHPWDFESLVVSGRMRNRRFLENAMAGGAPFLKSVIFAGAGGGLEGEPEPIFLLPKTIESVLAGQTYKQQADEIHASYPDDGTITLCRRLNRREDPDRALVYWERGNHWVTAEPRDATPEEVFKITQQALNRFDEIRKPFHAIGG